MAPSTLRRWLTRGAEDPEGEYGAFAHDIEQAEAQHGLRHLANLTKASDNGNVHASKYLIDRQRQRQAIRAGQAGPLPPREQELHDELRALVEDPVFRQVLALKSRLPGEEWPVFAEALREFIAHRG
jgi:hypothetical protein